MAQTSAPPIDRATLDLIVEGARVTYDNAEALYREAEILRAAGAGARALFLHQISLEECAKIETFGAWAASLLMGFAVDSDRLLTSLRSHKVKNHTNAYSLAATEEERAARERGDWDAAHAAFDKLQRAFHEESNFAKNAALYVDFRDGAFVGPDTAIAPERVEGVARLNLQYLEQAARFMRTFEATQADPDSRQAFVLDVLRQTEQFKDPMQSVEITRKLTEAFVKRVVGEATEET